MNKMKAKHTTAHVLETGLVAEKFAKDLLKKRTLKHAAVIGLTGDLGAGKTTFVKAFARGLGIKETVVSPTFVLERVYKLPKTSPFSHLVHIDAYRLKGAGELLGLGWDALIANPKNLIMIEWADNVAPILPQKTIHLFFSHKGGDKRNIEIKIQK
ncbi:MAG: tRNA (adenosine(37)-N6)-threonylcarbamoyltransferase complex ATPase subunit type 1 TsaE [Parcubacteria group bacterium]|nr:tRNA (adenosine(37)-N6)-threonylcarbamoyltransferase complex ATPase subunit type 1 TsaE [Parcubacteria group bacterium]